MDRADLTEHEEEIVELLPGSRHQSPDLSEPTPAAEAPPQRSDHLFEALPAAEARHDLIPAPSLPGAVEELRPESPPAPAPPAQPPAPPAQPAVRSDSIEARAAFLGKLGIQAAPHEPPPGRRSPVPPAPAPAPLEPVSVAAPSQVVSASSSMAGPSEITSAPGPPEGLAPMDDPGYSPTIRPNSGLGLLTSVPELISGPKIHNLKSNKKSDPTKEMIDTEQKSNDVDDIKARTMYRMVDQTSDGTKLVFFNNRQASLFNKDNIETLLEAFEIRAKPKLVIRLLPSSCGSETLKAMSVAVQNVMASKKDETYGERLKEAVRVQVFHDPDSIGDLPVPDLMAQPCYLSEERQAASEWNLELFCREVLVPLALETKALVIGNAFADDALFMAFCKAANAVKSKYGGKLPFTTFGMADAPCLSMACVTEGTATRKLYDSSISWRQRYPKILQAIGKDPDAEVIFGDIDHCIDVNPGIGNFIVTDCVDEMYGVIEGVNHEKKDTLTQTLLEYLVGQLPAIAVGTMHHYDAKYGGMHCSSMFNLASVSIPVLLLDVRGKEHYPKGLKGEALIEEAMKRHEDRLMTMRLDDKEDLFELSRISHFHSLLTHKSEDDDTPNQEPRRPLWENIGIKKKQKASSAQTPEERQLLLKVTEFCLKEEYKCYWGLMTNAKKEEAIQKGFKGFEDFFADQIKKAKMTYFNLLSSKGLHSANVVDLEYLHVLVRELCSMDKLPKSDSLESLMVVRTLWDTVDVGRKVLWYYKQTAKICYALLVLLGVATTTVTVLATEINLLGNLDDPDNPNIRFSNHQLLVFLLSTAIALTAAIQAFVNPVRRWQQLRDITASLESDMWRFRTRTGPFAMSKGPTEALKATVDEAWKKVGMSADVAETSFGRKHPPRTYKHGQVDMTNEAKTWFQLLFFRRGTAQVAAEEMEDAREWNDHYSPLQPEKYIAFRVMAMLEFYKGRIPSYSFSRELMSGLLMASSAAGAIIAFTWMPEYVAIITAITAGIMSWMEFSNVSKKLSRYNGSVVELEKVLLWWNHITPVDRASPIQIEKLVFLCEKAINSERQSWMSATDGCECFADEGNDDNAPKKKSL